MGEILEVMRRGFGVAILVVASALLAGCGTDTDSTGRAQLLVDTAKTVFRKDAAGPASSQDLGLTRASVAAVGSPLSLVTVEATGASALVVPFQRNGDVRTWSSTDDRTLSFRSDILIATRGLGADLMSSIAPSAAQIARGSGTHTRVYFHLDGNDQTLRTEFRCTLATQGTKTLTVVERNHATTLVHETCEGATGGFTNEYWVENGSTIRQSRETFDQKLGKLKIQRIQD